MPERSVLLTVSGAIPDDLDREVAAGRRPRADYRVIADVVGADVVDVDLALLRTGRLGRLCHRIGGAGVLLALYSFRRRSDYDVILTDGEQVGLPLALLCRLFGKGRARHVMIVHILSVPKKQLVIRLARIASLIDRYVVYCTAQQTEVVDRLGVPPERVVLLPFMVDTAFFAPAVAGRRDRSMICSAGLERRDYPTLMRAVDGLDVDVVIAAASPWSKQPDSSAHQSVPANVTIERLSLFELRDVYSAASFAVMPLIDVDFQAGITTILEAMSMRLPVICTRTEGQTDTIVEGESGRYVPIGDVDALRAAIVQLLGDPGEIERMGEHARAWAVAHADVERYAERIGEVVSTVDVVG